MKKKILELKTPGWLISEEGANLIVAIASHMNKRLSSNVSSSTKEKILIISEKFMKR